MSKIINALVLLGSLSSFEPLQHTQIEKNGMKVQWAYIKDRIFFEVEAPTSGWLAIGFNTSSAIEGNYLIMGHVVKGITTVIEHFTISAGNYKSFNDLNVASSIENESGQENNNQSKIKFSLPVKANNPFAKHLVAGTNYTLLLAYSQEDDFLHHSIMRTTIDIKL
jgi:hypothetical protein